MCIKAKEPYSKGPSEFAAAIYFSVIRIHAPALYYETKKEPNPLQCTSRQRLPCACAFRSLLLKKKTQNMAPGHTLLLFQNLMLPPGRAECSFCVCFTCQRRVNGIFHFAGKQRRAHRTRALFHCANKQNARFEFAFCACPNSSAAVIVCYQVAN